MECCLARKTQPPKKEFKPFESSSKMARLSKLSFEMKHESIPCPPRTFKVSIDI